MATVSLVTVEEINAKLENSVKEDMSYAGFAHGEYGPDGEIIDTHTPWACGFVEKEELIVPF